LHTEQSKRVFGQYRSQLSGVSKLMGPL